MIMASSIVKARSLRTIGTGLKRWEECQVLEYNEKERLFKVKWLDGKEKEVRWLNLIYENEHVGKHLLRIYKAREKQQIYEALARYWFELSKASNNSNNKVIISKDLMEGIY